MTKKPYQTDEFGRAMVSVYREDGTPRTHDELLEEAVRVRRLAGDDPACPRCGRVRSICEASYEGGN